MRYQDILDSLENIKEFAYYPDPIRVGLFLNMHYADKKLALYREGEHALGVASVFKNSEIISLVPKDGFILLEEAKEGIYDFIVLLGWWPDSEFLNFCETNTIDQNRLLRPYHDSVFRSFAKKLTYESVDNKFLKLSDNKPNIILFVFADIKDFVSRHSKYLKDEFNIIKIYIHPIEKVTEDNTYFAQTIFCDFNFHKFIAILSKFENSIDAVVMHLPASMFWIFIYLKSLLPKLKYTNLVTEGLIAIYNENKELCVRLHRLGCKEYEYAKLNENFLYSHSDAVITNIGGQINRDLSSQYSRIITFLEYPFGINPEFNGGICSRRTDKFSLVYAGGVTNDKTLPDNYFEEERYLVPVFEDLLCQGFMIDCFLGSAYLNDLPSMKRSGQFSNYFELCDKDAKFTMQPTLSETNLIKAIGKFDFGLMLYRFTDKNLQYMGPYYSCVVHAKLFSYLSAGLPVIINKELTMQAEFIESNGLGIAIGKDELCSLGEILKTIDYLKLKSSVKNFIFEFELEYATKTADIIASTIRGTMDKKGSI